jgi:hypothetical protein
MDYVVSFLKWSNDHGIWDAAQFLVVAFGLGIGVKLIFFPRRRIRNLNFFTRLERESHAQFPLRIHLELRNYTGTTVVLSSPFFVYRELRPAPQAHGDIPSGEYEIKFPNPTGQLLSEVEYLLRNKESVVTFIPLDPQHSDDEVKKALERQCAGTLTVICTWLKEKPQIEKLARRI